MSTTEDVKLPAIEHIKARKDGLDVLADIYRYAELGFDAIEPDDLALFRWYGIYTQRAEASAASGDPGPSEETDGYFMLRIKFPNGIVTADQLRAVGRLSERYGRGMGDITTRQNIQLHWLRIEDMPVDPRRAERGRALVHAGLRRRVAKRGRLPARGRRRARAHRLAAADRGARAHVRRRPPLLEPPAQVQGLGVGVPAPLRAARDQRHRARRGREGRRGRLRRLGRRRARRVGPHGPAARRLRPARGGGRRLPGDHRDLPRRGQALQAHACAHQVPGRRVGRGAAARRGGGSGSAARCRRRSSRPIPSIRTATTWASTRRCSRASTTWARPRSGDGSRATR